jgi:hypothetical protein
MVHRFPEYGTQTGWGWGGSEKPGRNSSYQPLAPVEFHNARSAALHNAMLEQRQAASPVRARSQIANTFRLPLADEFP